ncbi:MAG: heat-inducible transcriptional repressor HrcA [Holosporales bacterium]
MISEIRLDARTQLIFDHLMSAFCRSGEPVGSRTLAEMLPLALSSATIRNVMADLEEMGLVYAPHTSAGRLPTDLGLRFYVDHLMQTPAPPLDAVVLDQIEAPLQEVKANTAGLFERSAALLAELSCCAGVVIVPKDDAPIQHVDFVRLSFERILVVLVAQNGVVQNRLIEFPQGISDSVLEEVRNFLNALALGRTLRQLVAEIQKDIQHRRQLVDELSWQVAIRALNVLQQGPMPVNLILKGQAHLVQSIGSTEDLERLSSLFLALEAAENALKILNLVEGADGVRIFIGADSELFGMVGRSLILAPSTSPEGCVVGAVGVIGPTHLNYGRLASLVNQSARVLGRLLG